MKFFDRTKEIELLKEIKRESERNSQFTVITGRRRIGKTILVNYAFGEENIIYLFVSRKAEKDLCDDFIRELKLKLDIPLIGKVDKFAEIFELLMQYSKQRNLTVFIDEFQDFKYVNDSIFNDMQRIWDLNKSTARINLIVGGSINSLMNEIFCNQKQPLYQRETYQLRLKPFKTEVLKEIMSYYKPSYTPEDLLAMYAFTGGVAKYVELLVDSECFTLDTIVSRIIRDGSSFIDEGKTMLMGEFGREYGIYFSILSAIASGKTTRGLIEDAVGKEVSGYLTRLADDYELVSRKQPIFETSSNKRVAYQLSDNFLMFWFRFIYKYNSIIELGAYARLIELVKRDYSIFSGFMLERYFRAKMAESGQFTRIGSWWGRRGENEIDIVAVDEIEMRVNYAEVKRNPDKISLATLRSKVEAFLQSNPALRGYKADYLALSMEDM